MNRKNFLSLIILDIIVVLFALALIVFRYRSLTDHKLQPLPKPLREIKREYMQPMPREPEKTAPKPVSGAQPGRPLRAARPQKRNIGFTYRNSLVKSVAIIGSFNNWVPQPMAREADGATWKISMALEPGEYSYNFVADGRPLRDPYNPKASNAGRGFANSYLLVKPLPQEGRQSE